MQFDEGYLWNVKSENDRPKPILIFFVNSWKKRKSLENKQKINEIHLTKDFAKDVVTRRKKLQKQLVEQRQRDK